MPPRQPQALNSLQQLHIRGTLPLALPQQHLQRLGRLLDLNQEAMVGALGALVAVLKRVSAHARTGMPGAQGRRMDGGSATLARARTAFSGLARGAAQYPRSEPSSSTQEAVASGHEHWEGGDGSSGGGAIVVDRLADMSLQG
jgi:hypothetical protein